MTMHFGMIDPTAELLAKCRRTEYRCELLPLEQITSEAEAEEIQLAALDAFEFERKGYSVVGSSDESRRTLGLSKPIFSSVPVSAYVSSDSSIRLPTGTIGAQCEVAFTMLRNYPEQDEPINRATAADAILAFQPAIGILGYRTKKRLLGDFAAIADFGLRISLNRDSGFSKSRTSVSLSRGQRMRSNPGCLVAVTRDCVRLFRRRSRASAFFVCACCRLRE